MDTSGWESIWNRMLLVISEQTGLSHAQITAVLDAECAFWQSRPRLLNTALFGEEEIPE